MANILLVDDDEIILKAVNAALVKAGHTVFMAKDGHTANEMASGKESLHMVITDINLPHGISGFNLVKIIRDNPKTSKLPIMIISTRRTEQDVLRGVEAGVDDYVIKPIDFDIFTAKVNSLLSRGDQSFTLSRIDHKGTINMPVPMNIIGISEEGLQILSALKLEPNSKVSLDSDIFDEIGINKPILRVASCERLETDENPYVIKVNFIGLTPGDLQKIRVFTNKARLKPRT